jgi:hypothetical protein
MNKNCLSNQILNPKTKRCVKRDGKIGRSLLKENKKLKWDRNSCYMDSLIVAINNSNPELFRSKLRNIEKSNERLIKYQKNIKEEIDEIINNKREKCNILRDKIDKFYKELIKINSKIKILDRNENFINSQLDIFQLMELFDYVYDIKKDLKMIDGNNEITTSFDINVPIDLFIDKDEIKINKYFPKYNIKYNLENGKIFKKSVEIIKANKLMIKIYRNLGYKKLETRVKLSSSLKIRDNRNKLKLTSIIIHYGNNRGGHYITLYKFEGYWYEYDDMKDNVRKIGRSIRDINDNDKYTSNIVAILYS